MRAVILCSRFVHIQQMLAKRFPYLKIVLPTAPTQRVTMNMGMAMPSWYDITGLDERSNENCAGIHDSRKTIEAILETEHTGNQLAYSRMVLMGFSQGGALSVFTGYQLSQKLAGIVALSAYLPAASQFTIIHPDTPVLHCHGTADPLVTFPIAQKTKALLLEKGATKFELKSYAGLQHTVSMAELADVETFLAAVLPPDDTCKITVKAASEMSVKELKEAIRKAGLSHKMVGLMEKHEFVTLLQNHRDGK
jgi:lysophospholipase II